MYSHKIRTIHGVTGVLVFLVGSLWVKLGIDPLRTSSKWAASGQVTGHVAGHHQKKQQLNSQGLRLFPWANINTTEYRYYLYRHEHCGSMLCTHWSSCSSLSIRIWLHLKLNARVRAFSVLAKVLRTLLSLPCVLREGIHSSKTAYWCGRSNLSALRYWKSAK